VPGRELLLQVEPGGPAPAADVGAVLASLTVDRRRRWLRMGTVAAPIGLVLILVSMWVVRSWSATQRGLLAALGAAVLWYGLQQLGRSRDPRFTLGLWVSALWVVALIVLAVFASWLPTADYTKKIGPSYRSPALTKEFLGLDELGRSEVSRTIYGARVAFTIGAVGAGVGLVLGGLLGLMAGYYRGKVDALISIVSNALLAFPPLVLLLAVVALYDRSARNISLALAVITVPTFMRLTRAQTLVHVRREYVQSARAMGAKDRRIIFREILPNVVLPVASYTFLVVALLIVAEGSLAFVGVGINPPAASWGGMILKAKDRLRTQPHAVFVPAAAMFITVMSLNRVGEWARRKVGAADVRT
jgi:peptide/nickel transport system permease protein